MKTKVLNWLNREFVAIIGEGKPGAPPDQAATELFQQLDTELRGFGSSLDNTARIRVWGKDRDARTSATAVRSQIFTGTRRAASSSFISRDWFDGTGTAGIELLTLRPRAQGAQRVPVDFAPARNYLCYLDYDGLLFFSGYTSEAVGLEQQASEVIERIDKALLRAQTDWRRVVKLSALLQRGHDLAIVRRAVERSQIAKRCEVEFSFVDGFAGEKYLLEIEATAIR
jgi:enamine deaminase RidA (YjgF/YER057c/UK114 family)